MSKHAMHGLKVKAGEKKVDADPVMVKLFKAIDDLKKKKKNELKVGPADWT